ncbi:uncharacterized protein CLUP02_01538 [Colletotrichum lupini]|uniref:Uncharacterized protein n=1 Tax=Colletotrichum lupini TaxID=145971 RepID=A0A9Q8W9D9_9PEZI|nr:uncharacterized protein CLUP02_01538 [Colletotrichum lupini]UQC74886.1 hypothetical protein CLUP02_01538 [Colletotrichum lupini]
MGAAVSRMRGDDKKGISGQRQVFYLAFEREHECPDGLNSSDQNWRRLWVFHHRMQSRQPPILKCTYSPILFVFALLVPEIGRWCGYWRQVSDTFSA